MKALVALVALAGCAPAVIWTGHTADRRHTVEIAKRGDLQWVTIDGARRGAYRSIAAWSIASDGARVAYAAMRGRAWVVVDDGPPSADWGGIGELIVAGPHTAYSAHDHGWHVVVDGVVGARFEGILAGTLRLAGGRPIYVAQDADTRVHLVDGDAVGPGWDGIGQLVVSADGAHTAYAARRGTDAVVVADGAVGPAFHAIAKLALAGAAPVYAALDDAGWHVVTTATSAPYHAVRAIVVRGDHAAWLARDGAGDLVTCDGAVVGRAPRIADDSLVLVRGCDVAYVTLDDDGARFVHGGATALHDELAAIVVSPAGDHVGYAARTGALWDVFVDGSARRGGDWAASPVFSPDGAHAAYLARRGNRMVVILDDEAVASFDFALDDTLAFSRDGRHWAVIAGDLRHEQLFFAVDGVHRVPLAMRELYSAAAQLSVDGPLLSEHGDLLRRWSAAEADKL